MKTFIVDFDGTLVDDAWPQWGNWLPGAQDALKELLKHGRVKIWSSRLSPYQYGHDGDPEALRDPQDIVSDWTEIRRLLDDAGLQAVDIHDCEGKPSGDVYIDNLAVRFDGDWDSTLSLLNIFKEKTVWPTLPHLEKVKQDGGDMSKCLRCGHDKDRHRWLKLSRQKTFRCFESLCECGSLPDISSDIDSMEEEDKAVRKAALRIFNTGATRDTDEGKLDPEAALSPLVVQRYCEYKRTHRALPDGSQRPDDGWQLGIPKDSYMKSLQRHNLDAWLLHRGWRPSTETDLESALCAVIFNASGYLHELLRERVQPGRVVEMAERRQA